MVGVASDSGFKPLSGSVPALCSLDFMESILVLRDGSDGLVLVSTPALLYTVPVVKLLMVVVPEMVVVPVICKVADGLGNPIPTFPEV